MNQSEEKPGRQRTVGGSIIRKKKTVKTRRGEKEVEELYARVRRDGREKKRKINSVAEAAHVFRQLDAEFEDEAKRAAEIRSGDGKTFADLIEYFEREFVKEAVWRDDQVIEGFREPLHIIRSQLKTLNEYFGASLLREITYDDLRRYRSLRLQKPIYIHYKTKVPVDKSKLPSNSRKQFDYIPAVKTKERKTSSVNRELARLRGLLNHAIRLGWIDVNPFKRGASLISAAAENERMRILSKKEEIKLLEVCSEPERAHLRPLVIFALDTAMRKGEILKLKWSDVDFDQNVIWAEGKNTKTLKPRIVPLTSRLKTELLELWLKSDKNPEKDLFPIKEMKRAFGTACRKAGIEDFRFHDLRHTATTRMQAVLKDSAKTMKITGHTQMKTFQRYNNIDVEIAQEVGALLDKSREENEAQVEENRAPNRAPKVVGLNEYNGSKKL
jgi:integrase